jgi:tungstate transport system permease protein
MSFLWHQLHDGTALIVRGDPFVWGLLWVTIKVALISTAVALVIGLPLGLAIGLGRFRGRRGAHVLANASLALPPVAVGIFVLILLLPQGAFGSLRIEFTLYAVYLVQAILALPYIVALTAAAVQGLAPGLLGQARALGASRLQLAGLAVREARIGVIAAVIAAMGAAVSEVGAVIIVGGNFQGQTSTLASALLSEFTFSANDPRETAIALMLGGLVLVLLGGLTVIQQLGSAQPRFRAV